MLVCFVSPHPQWRQKQGITLFHHVFPILSDQDINHTDCVRIKQNHNKTVSDTVGPEILCTWKNFYCPRISSLNFTANLVLKLWKTFWQIKILHPIYNVFVLSPDDHIADDDLSLLEMLCRRWLLLFINLFRWRGDYPLWYQESWTWAVTSKDVTQKVLGSRDQLNKREGDVEEY